MFIPMPVESVVRDVLYTGRSFRRAPLAALTIVTTVALGLGLVAVVFTFLNEVIFAWTRCATRTSCSRSSASDPPRRRPTSFTRSQY